MKRTLLQVLFILLIAGLYACGGTSSLQESSPSPTTIDFEMDNGIQAFSAVHSLIGCKQFLRGTYGGQDTLPLEEELAAIVQGDGSGHPCATVCEEILALGELEEGYTWNRLLLWFDVRINQGGPDAIIWSILKYLCLGTY